MLFLLSMTIMLFLLSMTIVLFLLSMTIVLVAALMRIKVPSVDDIHGISKFYENRVYSCVDDGHVVSSVGVNHSPSLAVSGCSLSLCLRPSVCLWFLFPTPSGSVCSVSIAVHNIQIKLKSQDVQVIYDTLR